MATLRFQDLEELTEGSSLEEIAVWRSGKQPGKMGISAIRKGILLGHSTFFGQARGAQSNRNEELTVTQPSAETTGEIKITAPASDGANLGGQVVGDDEEIRFTHLPPDPTDAATQLQASGNFSLRHTGGACDVSIQLVNDATGAVEATLRTLSLDAETGVENIDIDIPEVSVGLKGYRDSLGSTNAYSVRIRVTKPAGNPSTTVTVSGIDAETTDGINFRRPDANTAGVEGWALEGGGAIPRSRLGYALTPLERVAIGRVEDDEGEARIRLSEGANITTVAGATAQTITSGSTFVYEDTTYTITDVEQTGEGNVIIKVTPNSFPSTDALNIDWLYESGGEYEAEFFGSLSSPAPEAPGSEFVWTFPGQSLDLFRGASNGTDVTLIPRARIKSTQLASGTSQQVAGVSESPLLKIFRRKAGTAPTRAQIVGAANPGDTGEAEWGGITWSALPSGSGAQASDTTGNDQLWMWLGRAHWNQTTDKWALEVGDVIPVNQTGGITNVNFSVSGTSWHNDYASTDRFMRFRLSNNMWSGAIPLYAGHDWEELVNINMYQGSRGPHVYSLPANIDLRDLREVGFHYTRYNTNGTERWQNQAVIQPGLTDWVAAPPTYTSGDLADSVWWMYVGWQHATIMELSPNMAWQAGDGLNDNAGCHIAFRNPTGTTDDHTVSHIVISDILSLRQHGRLKIKVR